MTASDAAGRGRYSIYTGRATNWLMVAFSAALVVPLLVMGKSSKGSWSDLVVPGLVLAGSLLVNLLTACSVRTTAGPGGVTVRFGLLGWPRCAYALNQIERADVIHLRLWYVAYGFWWSRKRTCCTVRSGPTLRLTLLNGRTVTVTVPDPRAAAAVLREAAAA